jgi:hypothetical protein
VKQLNRIKSAFGLATLVLGAGFAFQALAGTISGSFEPVAAGSNVDLTLSGKTDWIHWGLYTDTSINRKSGVTPMIGDFALLGTGVVYAYQYGDNYNGYTWYDGSPVTSQTNTTTGVWAYQAFPPELLGAGFQLSVPADSTPRILQVFVGAFAARGQFQATLSDGGLPYTDTSLFNSGNGPGGVYVLNYKANSPGQTLTVKWTLYQRAAGSNSITGNITLQAATLTATNADNPPFVRITEPTNQAAYTTPTNIPLEAVAEDYDGWVTNLSFFAAGTKLGQVSASPYTFDWNNPGIGRYLLSALAEDNSGGSRYSPSVEVFVCATGGQLAGSVKDAPGTVNLTAEGTSDWVHWGLVTNTSVDRKSGVSPLISNLIVLGTNRVQRYSDNLTSFSWSDGTPTPATNGTTTGIFVTRLRDGFQLILPADTNRRTARIYVGGYGVQANFEAYLSDLSARPYIDNSVSNLYDNSYAVYTLDYAAASAGKTLLITYHIETLFDFDYGNVTLQAVTLQGPATTALPRVSITNAFRTGNSFVLSFNTQTNQNYTVQYTESLSAPIWTNLVTLPGDGATLTVTDQNLSGDQRYYRVQTQ